MYVYIEVDLIEMWLFFQFCYYLVPYVIRTAPAAREMEATSVSNGRGDASVMSTPTIGHRIGSKSRTEDIRLDEDVSFVSLSLDQLLVKGLSKSGFERPSPIQLAAIPVGRCGLGESSCIAVLQVWFLFLYICICIFIFAMFFNLFARI